MKIQKLVITSIILLFILIPIISADGKVCSEDEICQGDYIGGYCYGDCVSKGEEDSCPFIERLNPLSECNLNRLIETKSQEAKKTVVDTTNTFLFTQPEAIGNKKLWQLSYSISFLLAIFLLITTTISYFKLAQSSSSNVEAVNYFKSQIFKIGLMVMLLFGSSYMAEIFTAFFGVLNEQITSTLGFTISDWIAGILGGLAVLAVLILLSLGVGLVAFVMIILSFLFVAGIRILILNILLSLIPIAIVLYFFDFTKKIGATIFKFTFAHLIIGTIWITIFGVAADISQRYTLGIAHIFFFLGAFFINSMLYFKINSFFASLEPRRTTQTVVRSIVTHRKVVSLREGILTKFRRSPQKTLHHFK